MILNVGISRLRGQEAARYRLGRVPVGYFTRITTVASADPGRGGLAAGLLADTRFEKEQSRPVGSCGWIICQALVTGFLNVVHVLGSCPEPWARLYGQAVFGLIKREIWSVCVGCRVTCLGTG